MQTAAPVIQELFMEKQLLLAVFPQIPSDYMIWEAMSKNGAGTSIQKQLIFAMQKKIPFLKEKDLQELSEVAHLQIIHQNFGVPAGINLYLI